VLNSAEGIYQRHSRRIAVYVERSKETIKPVVTDVENPCCASILPVMPSYSHQGRHEGIARSHSRQIERERDENEEEDKKQSGRGRNAGESADVT
jgi:hypothetical protein